MLFLCFFCFNCLVILLEFLSIVIIYIKYPYVQICLKKHTGFHRVSYFLHDCILYTLDQSDITLYGLCRTSEGVLWSLALRCSQQVLQVEMCDLCGSDLFVPDIPQILDQIKIWGICSPSQHQDLFIIFLKSFLNNLCGRANYPAERDHFQEKQGYWLPFHGLLIIGM